MKQLANHTLHLTRHAAVVGNGFTRARSFSPAGEFLSPFPKRFKCCVAWGGSLSLGH